jgi:hypothetical protein
VTKVQKRFKKTLTKRVTVKEPPAGALLASKKKKAKSVTKVEKRLKKNLEHILVKRVTVKDCCWQAKRKSQNL